MFRLAVSSFFVLFLAFSSTAEVQNIDNRKLQFLSSNGVSIIDIREEFEWRETGVVPESHLITFFDSEGRYDVKKWISKVKMITSNYEPLIIICRSGRRSLIVANFLSKNKLFPMVYNVEAGIKGWISEDLKTQIYQ